MRALLHAAKQTGIRGTRAKLKGLAVRLNDHRLARCGQPAHSGKLPLKCPDRGFHVCQSTLSDSNVNPVEMSPMDGLPGVNN